MMHFLRKSTAQNGAGTRPVVCLPISILVIVTNVLALCSAAIGDGPDVLPVEVCQKPDGEGWQLIRDGHPYRVQGAAGPGSLELLAQCGGNSTRTWAVDDDTQRRLDEAHRNGCSVVLGIWIEHETKGFDYQDYEQVSDQIDDVLEAVRKYRNHPALLVWGIGNEMEGYQSGDNPAVWGHIEHLCRRVKQEDPQHPVMTVIAEIGGNRVAAINRFCPSLDIIGINAYGGAATLPQRYRAAGGTKPYIVTEFGPTGPWESSRNSLDMVIEPTSSIKAQQYRQTFESLQADRQYCLGSFAFMWGSKQEATATWFGMLLDDGRKTNAVDVMTELWTGSRPANRCPEIRSLTLNSDDDVDSGSLLDFALDAFDPEGAAPNVEWVLLAEADSYATGGDFQSEPENRGDAIVASDRTSARIKAPQKAGMYRLYAYVDDGQGAVATANVPFRVRERPLEAPGRRISLPVVVYDEPESPSPFDASDMIGNTAAIELDEECALEPKFGHHCLRCKYTGADGQGGVLWQHTPDEKDEMPAGFDLSGAERLTVWARGTTGGEALTIGLGDLKPDRKYPDTARKKKVVKLSRHWRKFHLDLEKSDLRRIKSGFWWSVESEGVPIEFFLDRIVIE